MSKKQPKETNQSAFNLDQEIEQEVENTTKKDKSVDNNIKNDEKEPVSKKKIDNYIPPVSPMLAEINALNNIFSSFAKLPPVEVDDIPVSSEEQINYPEIKKGYELAFDYDKTSETERIHKKLKAIVKGLNGYVSEPSVFEDSCSVSVQLPVTLEEATAFFDKYLKIQFSEQIKMSGTIYKEGYAFVATASEEKIKEIKQNWVRFSNGGKCRELFQHKNHLTMVFQDEDDYIKNSSILGISGTEKDGVKFTTEVETIRIKEAVNYNPKRILSPD